MAIYPDYERMVRPARYEIDVISNNSFWACFISFRGMRLLKLRDATDGQIAEDAVLAYNRDDRARLAVLKDYFVDVPPAFRTAREPALY